MKHPRLHPLTRNGWILAFLCLLLTLPSWILLGYTGNQPGNLDALISRHITEAWQAGFWTFPGLSPKTSGVIADVLALLAVAGMGWAYWLGYRYLVERPGGLTTAGHTEHRYMKRILLGALAFGLLLIFVIPFDSNDIYGYINRGAQQAVFGINPYIVTVGQTPNWEHHPLFHAHWLDNPSPYGFFFTALTGWMVRLTGESFAVAFLGFKLLSFAAHLGITLLIYAAAKRLQHPKPWLPAYLYAWNPLILLEMLANGHNDLLLSGLLLAALYMLLFTRHAWACLPLLTLSILTKYASLLALPFILVYLLRQRRWLAMGGGIVLSLLLAGLIAWPYLPGLLALPPKTAQAMAENASLSQHSLNSAISRLLYYTVGPFVSDADALLSSAREILKKILLAGFALLYAGVGLRYADWLFRHSPNDPDSASRLIRRIVQMLMVLILLVSAKFHAWYVGMFLPLALLLPESCLLFRTALYVSLFQLLSFTPLENLHVLNYVLLVGAPVALAFRQTRASGWRH